MFFTNSVEYTFDGPSLDITSKGVKISLLRKFFINCVSSDLVSNRKHTTNEIVLLVW